MIKQSLSYEPPMINPPLARPPLQQTVTLVVTVEWAQALARLQQLHNEGVTLVRLLEDEERRVRISAEIVTG